MTAPPDSAAHLNAYPEFTSGSTVMALYPDTSCFYRADVIESPTDMAKVGRVVYIISDTFTRLLVDQPASKADADVQVEVRG